MPQKIKLRHGTAATWTAENPTLDSGEVGVETDTHKMKVGDAATAWVALAYSSGASTYADLGGLKTVNGSSLQGTGDLVVAGVGGQTDATDIATFTAALPFDVTGFGSRVVDKTLSALVTLSVGVGAVEGGSCEVTFIGDGNSGHTVVFPSGWVKRGVDVIDTTLNGYTKFVGEYSKGTVIYGLIPLGVYAAADVTPPTLVSATVPDADPSRINLLWSEAIDSATVSAAPFAVSAGHTLTGHVYDTATTTHLVTSTAFIPGETRTLAYTQPVANKLADLAGNLLVNFSGTAITDSVTAPTCTAAVANATPTHIDLTWSEAISSTISASAAFTVSAGHTLTAHTYVDSTHTYLTTSTAFVAAETKTLAYVVPGANPMKDAGGTAAAAFSGLAITDNVSGGAKVTFTDPFTGADNDAPNARWTGDTAGWTIQSNKLSFDGASYSFIKATCTAGDNTVSVDVDLNSFGATTFSYAGVVIRYVDDNNYTSIVLRGENSEIMRMTDVVAGVATTIANDTVPRFATTANLAVAVVGNACTVTVTGGSAPGGFSGTLSGSNASATKIGLAMNSGHSTCRFDNCVLA